MRIKIIELKEAGYSDREIIENIFLNYPSKYQNDSMYKIKKKISTFFEVPINNIKLIGSAHSGLKIEDEELKFSDNPGDLDFAIIDSNCYINQLSKINQKKMVLYRNRNEFNGNLYYGKIHYKYLKKINNETFNYLTKIKEELEVEKNISVCIYLSEDFFLKGLESFFNNIITSYYNGMKDVKKLNNTVELKALKEFR